VRFFDDIVASVVSLDELVFYRDAATDPCWVSAMQQEMDSIHAKDNEKNILYTMVVAIEQIGGGESCVVWR
jgi:hypothetical protein